MICHISVLFLSVEKSQCSFVVVKKQLYKLIFKDKSLNSTTIPNY